MQFLAASACSALLLSPHPALADAGTINGRVLDADGRPVPDAVVVVCDAESGIPISRDTGQRFTRGMTGRGPLPDDLLTAATDLDGHFSFVDVATGSYRLVAQRWADRAEPVGGLFEVNGAIVDLHGVAERVLVPSDAARRLELRPLGTASVHVDQQFANDRSLLVVSRAPPAADPVLGFASWSGDLVRGMIGGNRMPRGATTVRGLPPGAVHLAVFSADDSPGFGAMRVRTRPGRRTAVRIPVVAAWSGAVHDPPETLAPLVEEVRRDRAGWQRLVHDQLPEMAALMDRQPGSPLELWAAGAARLDRDLVLPDGRLVPFARYWTAVEYIRLQENLAKRGRTGAGAPRRNDAVSYEDALEALHGELGRRYPCFALKGIDWPAVGAELLPRAALVDDDEAFGLLCMELVARLEDSHARLLPGAADPPAPPFPAWDPGFACLVAERAFPVVYHVERGSPAEQAGVRPGMTVLAVNGEPAEILIERTEHRMRRYAGFSSDRNARYHAFRSFMNRENEAEAIEVATVDPDGHRASFTLAASFGRRYLPRLPVPIDGVRESANVSWTMLDDGAGYVYVRRIREDLIPKLDAAVAALAGARGLIIDVRGNGGGGFDGRRAHLNFDLLRERDEPERPRYRGPIALLVDAGCVSAGEGWASWFVARGRARLFGEATAGASARKTEYALKNGLYRVRFPVKAYTGYLDRPIERVGLRPDEPMLPSAPDVWRGRDTVLEAAKAYLVEAAEAEPVEKASGG